MKNKKLTYVLLIFVLIVWGIIIFKVINVSDNQIQLKKNDPVTFSTNENFVSDTFSLLLNYKDPFLRNYSPKKISFSAPDENLKNYHKIKPLTEKKEPKIEYLGIIKNKNSNNTLALLKINSHEVIVNTHNKSDSIQVMFINNDSIAIKYSKNIYRIGKAKQLSKKS